MLGANRLSLVKIEPPAVQSFSSSSLSLAPPTYLTLSSTSPLSNLLIKLGFVFMSLFFLHIFLSSYSFSTSSTSSTSSSSFSPHVETLLLRRPRLMEAIGCPEARGRWPSWLLRRRRPMKREVWSFGQWEGRACEDLHCSVSASTWGQPRLFFLLISLRFPSSSSPVPLTPSLLTLPLALMSFSSSQPSFFSSSLHSSAKLSHYRVICKTKSATFLISCLFHPLTKQPVSQFDSQSFLRQLHNPPTHPYHHLCPHCHRWQWQWT